MRHRRRQLLHTTRFANLAAISLGFALVAGCVPMWSTNFTGIEPISPPVTAVRSASPVDSLQPELRWKPAKGEGITYDLAVWDSGLKPDQAQPTGTMYWGTVVYQREGLTGTAHRVEPQLKPGTLYFWSVRTRQGTELGHWSTYDGWFAVAGPLGWVRRSVQRAPFMFTTPGQ